MQQDLFYQLLC